MAKEHQSPSFISNEIPFKLETLSSESLASIIENDTETNSNQFSSIPYIDSSSFIEDEELQSSSDLSRRISLSESDLLTSLHRNKQIIDNPSEDDILFLEWDKERNLFQDYINSLRKEIRVLLQERLDYRQHSPKHHNDEQMKIDLLQKSLEEKNFVIEQLQTDYELIKEKNSNLIRKISLVQCDTKSNLGIMDELKQKIADLTIDLQNHVLVKRRLEMSISNLENDCQIIDTERIRLTNEMKENQHQKQDLEKLLQIANVQIAEQGSTIEMLRSENVQVRSQLSTIQRRMFQEKQQIMDYLRQIENDLIEKEQIKQRESLLRQDYEHLKTSINQDQQKLEELKQQSSQLLKENNHYQSEIKHFYTHFHIPMESDDRSNLSVDEIIQPIENRFKDLQNQNDILTNQVNELQTIIMNQTGEKNLQRSDNEEELRQNLALLTTQCAQLDEANRAWQQFQQVQLDNFRNKLQNNLPIEQNSSFDEIAQFIVDYLTQLINERDHLIQNLQTAEKIPQQQLPHTELSSLNSIKQIHGTPPEEISLHNLTSVQSTPSLINEQDEELRHLRETIAALTLQCAQLNEANRAWQQYQLTQLDQFRNKLEDYFDFDEHFSFDQAAQLIVEQIIKEREEFHQQYEDLRLESATNLETIKQSYINTINELTRELLVVKEELDKRMVDTNQSQSIEILRNRFEDSLSIDYNLSLDEIAQQIVDEIQKERKDLNERYQALEKENHRLRLETETNLETIRQSYVNTVNELNLELLALQEQSVTNNQEPDTETIESSSSDSNAAEIHRIYEELRNLLSISDDASLEEIVSYINNLIQENNSFREKELTSAKDLENVNLQLINVYHQCEQLREYNQQLLFGKQDDQVQQEYLSLQNQCTQLDNANRAWQQFYDNHIDLMRNQFKDYLDFDENINFNQIIQTIATELQQQKNPLGTTTKNNGLSTQSSFDTQQNDQILSLQEEIKSLENQLKDNQSSIDLLKNNLQLTTSENDQLKQQYNEIQEKYDLLIQDNHHLTNQLNGQHVSQSQQLRPSSIEESSLHTTSPVQSPNTDEIQQLQSTLSLLTMQCSQLDEANRAWQQFHQNQLELLREKLPTWIPINTNSTLEQITEQILTQLDSLQKQLSNYQYNESILAPNLEELNQKLLDLHKQCEEFREHNAQLILSKQQVEKQLEEREYQIKDLELSRNHFEQQNEENINHIRRKFQEYSPIDENASFDQIVQLVFDQIRKEREEFNDRHQVLEKENHDLRIASDNNLESMRESCFHTIQELNQELFDLKEQNKNLNDQINSNPFDQQLQSKTIEQNHIAIETIPLIYQNNQTQMDPIQMIHQQNQTESLWSLSDDENFQTDDNEQINEYITEISSLSSIDQSNQLQKECEQILSKQKLNLTATLTLELNQLALITLYSLSNQHLIDEAKQLYNETIIRALKQEYELVNQEKNDLIQQIELDRVHSNELNEKLKKIEIDNQQQVMKSQLSERDEQIEILTQDRDKYDERISSFSRINHTIDNETQTDDQQQEKSVQINNKLRRVLQTIEEKVHSLVTERPELFSQSTDDTIERLDQLISVIDDQSNQIKTLQNERDLAQQEINELRSSFGNGCAVLVEQLTSQAPLFDDYQKQIDQLQQNLSQKDEERASLQERLYEAELELSKTLDDQTLTTGKFEATVEQQSLQLTEFEHEIEQLREEIAQLKQTGISSEEEIQSLKEKIEQQSQELKDLSEKYLSQTESQDELNRQKREIEEQLNEHKNEIDNIKEQRTKLLEEVEKKTVASIQTTDNESQTDDRQHEKLVQVNNKLKRVLQTFKDKIHRAVTERPDLFDGIGEETSERLDHLISTVDNQAIQIDVLRSERDQVEEQLGNEIKHLQSSLEASQNTLSNERAMKMEQLSSSPEETSSSVLEDYQKQIEEMQQNLSEKDNERISLNERLKEVELELRKTLNDHASTMTKYQSMVEERDAFIEQDARHSAESQREIEQLKEKLVELEQSHDYEHVESQTDEDIEVLRKTIEQQSQQFKDLNEQNTALSSQLKSQDELDRQRREIEEQLKERENQVDDLVQERTKLLKELETKTVSPTQTTDNESQTDDRQHEKLVQINNKLKRALQTFKDKIHRAVTKTPDLFDGVGEETSERLDHLITTVENQATQMNVLRTERDQADEEYQHQIKELQSSLEACQYALDHERQIEMERLISTAPSSSPPAEDISFSVVEDYQKQIKQLQQTLSQKDDERILLRERLDEVELALRKTLDDHASTMIKYQSLVEERDALIEQEARHSAESRSEIEHLREELPERKQLPNHQHAEVQTDEDIKALHETIEQQSQQLKDLNEKTTSLLSQLKSQNELDREKREIEERLKEHENQIDNLKEERTHLLEEVEKKKIPSIQITNNESQTDDRQHEKLVQVNNKLKRVLQTFKDKIHRAVTERPDLFDGVGEETSERLDHLLATVGNQATQIDAFNAERDRVEEQLRNEMKELQSSLETSQRELDHERQVQMEQLSSSPTENISSSVDEDYRKQIEELQQNLFAKDNERSSLNERLIEVERELRKTLDSHASVMTKYQSLIKERDALIEQQARHSVESQREIEQLKEKLAEFEESHDYEHLEIQTDEDIKILHEMIEQQSQQLKDLNEKNAILSSQLKSQNEMDKQKKEIEEQIQCYRNQNDVLIQERANLLEELEKKTVASVQTTDNESQTDDRQHEMLVQQNNKLKRALQVFKDKIHRVVMERPDLFDGIGEETSERLDHLIGTVDNQAIQIDVLRSERDQVEEQLGNEIKQLQSALETSQNELDHERAMKMEQLSASPEDMSSSLVEDYQKKVEQLQQSLSDKDHERSSLSERLIEVEFELKQTLDNHASKSIKYEENLQSLVQERIALIEQQTLHSEQHQREIEQWKKDNEQIREELAVLKQPTDGRHVDVQTEEDINALHELIGQQTEQLKSLNERCLELSAQIDSFADSQVEADRQKNETEAEISDYKNQIENLVQERVNLFEEIEKKTLSSVPTTDNESQTNDRQHEELVQSNNKLKGVLQTIEDQIHQVNKERPDLFDGIEEETSERVRHLISTVENQATQIDVLHSERDHMEKQLQKEIQQLQSALETSQNELDHERQMKTEQLSSPPEDISLSIVEDYQKQIEELQQNLSEKNNERSLLGDRLNEVELELRKTLDDQAAIMTKYQTSVENEAHHSAESQREIEQLKKEIAELKQLPDYQHVEVQTDEDIEALHQTIEEQSQQLKDLNEKTVSLFTQLKSQDELTQQKKEIEEQLNEHKNQITNLIQERARLLEEIEKNISTPLQTTDNESQTDDREHEKLVQANNTLKHVLQTCEDRIHRAIIERPALFDGTGEEISDRLDHLLATIGNQATQIDTLHAERDRVEEQLRGEMKEVQSSVEAYRYQIENEGPIKTEQLLTTSPTEDLSPSVLEDYQKQIEELRQTLSGKENERSSLNELLNEVELELRKTLDDHASTMAKYQSLVKERDALVEQQTLHSTESQREIEQLKREVTELKQLPDYLHVGVQTDEGIKALNEMIEQLKDLNEENASLSSQLDSQAELNKQKRELEERLNEHKTQIDNLMQERAKLLDEHQKLLEVNKSLKSVLETMDDKIHHLLTTRPDLFGDIGENTSKPLDHLISTIEQQATQMTELQTEHDKTKEKYQHEMNTLQNSFDIYRQETDEYISSLTPTTHEIETQTIDVPTIEIPNFDRRDTQTTESDDNESNTWFDASPDITEKEEIAHQQYRDIDIQCELDKLSSPPLSTTNSTQTEIDVETEKLKTKIQQTILEYSTLFSTTTQNPSDDLDQIISLIKNLQNEIKELQSSFDTYRNEIENERLINMEKLPSHDVNTQTLGLSIFEEYEKLRENELNSQREIQRLTEERNQVRDLLSQYTETQTNNNSEQNKQVTSSPLKLDVAIQTIEDLDLLLSSDQNISRRIFEEEMLAWSKESEQLKRFVKQIQIENKKLKTILLKFETIIHDYTHENERLKQENHHLSWNNYSSIPNENFTTSDQDVCYLTLKWLTYEVAQRTSNNEQSVVLTNHSEQDLKQQFNDTERQTKAVRVQNERLKNQLETYTIQFKHIQHEMSVKIQEMSTLKDQIERLRTNEIQSRVELDRLKTELQNDQLKIQQLESELSNLRFKQSNKDHHSIENLRELLDLKERELNALKEKLDYTKQTHQIELQEALKANQFSHDNAKRFEQMDLCHEEKRRELETRLGKFCTITRPLITNQQLFRQNPIINIDELRKLIAETDNEERVANSLSPIRDCLSLLEAQMKDLHHNIIENHARRSKRWKYKLGFECLSCESRWEVTHDIRDLQEACLDPSRFLESSMVEPMAGCACPIMIDFVESDIRLCLDDILNDVIGRTTVK